ncbi:hypothetical protein TWF506_004393 [Arthrobotrys conoides]|uniref:BTB domain-containing protein n=1 Tax=Arthrobotrys conoides TaxID=74498 RepID=A0AAN8NFP8_9PEZI
MPVTTRSQKRKAEEGTNGNPKRGCDHSTENKSESEKPGDKNLDFQKILILVGPRGSRFNVQTTILLAASDFFKAALRPESFKEGKEGVIRLPEIEPTVFKNILKLISNVTTYENLTMTKPPTVILMFMTADYLLLDSFKLQILMNIAYRVSAYLQNTYLQAAITSYKNQVGSRATIYKFIHPKPAIEIMSSIYQYCHPSDIKHAQRCLLVIAAATEEVKDIENDTKWGDDFTAIWATAKNGIANAKKCRRCNTFWEKIEGCATRMLPWSNQVCTCWRRFFNTGHRSQMCPEVGGMDALK